MSLILLFLLCFFFFKQKTAYEMRISDWSSDVCSSDLGGMAMIQVPAVEIAGYRTGPAWFSARPDKAFHEYMAQWMDQPVDGALGGETFRGFRITVNYRAETAVFER